MADVVMNYDLMRAMTAEFQSAADDLDDILSGLGKIQAMVDDGALTGRGATQFQDLLENGILPYTKTLQAKMQELADDVEGARAFLEDGDSTAASKFK